MKILKLASTFICLSFLTGCIHVQLFGTVGGARVAIATLADPDTIVAEGDSLSPEGAEAIFGSEDWAGLDLASQLFWVGIMNPSKDEVDAQTV